MRHQGLQDGVMDIVFASDLDDPRVEPPRYVCLFYDEKSFINTVT